MVSWVSLPGKGFFVEVPHAAWLCVISHPIFFSTPESFLALCSWSRVTSVICDPSVMGARRALGLDSPSGTLKEPEGPGSQATASFLIAV